MVTKVASECNIISVRVGVLTDIGIGVILLSSRKKNYTVNGLFVVEWLP